MRWAKPEGQSKPPLSTPPFPRSKEIRFHAILFEPAGVNAAALFQITSLAVQSSRVAVIVLGSAADEAFAVEVIAAGAQDFLAKEEFTRAKTGARHPLRD